MHPAKLNRSPMGGYPVPSEADIASNLDAAQNSAERRLAILAAQHAAERHARIDRELADLVAAGTILPERAANWKARILDDETVLDELKQMAWLNSGRKD